MMRMMKGVMMMTTMMTIGELWHCSRDLETTSDGLSVLSMSMLLSSDIEYLVMNYRHICCTTVQFTKEKTFLDRFPA